MIVLQCECLYKCIVYSSMVQRSKKYLLQKGEKNRKLDICQAYAKHGSALRSCPRQLGNGRYFTLSGHHFHNFYKGEFGSQSFQPSAALV